MPFKKGQSGNPAGRPKGSTNVEINLVKEAYSDLINANLKIIIKMSDYVLPKLTRVRHIQEVEHINIEISVLKSNCQQPVDNDNL